MAELGKIERFLQARFAAASIAVVGGSTARGTRTATSDIDLLIVGPGEMFEPGRDSVAAAYEFDGERFEVFAYTSEALDWWLQHDLVDLRPVLHDILLTGIDVRVTSELDALRARWRPLVDHGPQINDHQLALRRYAITDLLDDLNDTTNPLEGRIVAHDLFTRLGELMLLSYGHWLGSGKWLVRRLRDWDAERTDALAAPLLAGNIRAFVAAAEFELAQLGGRVDGDFVR